MLLRSHSQLWLALLLACAPLAPAVEPAGKGRISQALADAERFATAGQWKEALEAGNRLRTLSMESGEENRDLAMVELFLGEVRDHLGDRTLAEAHFRHALTIQEKVLTPDAAELAATLTRLAACLKDQQRYDEAAGLLQRAYDLQLKLRGPDDLDTAVAARNLARVLRLKRDYPRAAQLLQSALAVQRREGGHDPETLAGLRELAQAHEAAGDPAAAELDTAERVVGATAEYGEYSAELAAALSDWGRLAEAQEHFAEAEPRYRRALAIVEASFATDEALLADQLTQLGWCLRNLSRFDEALPLLQRALDLRRHRFGPDEAQTAASYRLLGWVHRLKRDFTTARPLFEKALNIREAALGAAAPLTLESLGELGELDWQRGDYDEAASLLEKRRYTVEQATGPASEETAAAWHGLALVYETAKRWPQATEAALRSLRSNEKRLGPADPRTLSEMVLLSRICEAAGEPGPALTQYARLLTWFNQHPEASGRAELLRQYAVTTLRAKKPDAAGPLFLESRRAHEADFGPNAPATLRSIADLWTYYDATRQPTLALETARDLVARSETALGADAPATSAVYDRVGQLCLTLGDRVEALKWFRRALDGRRRHFGVGSDESLDALAQVAFWFEQARDFTTASALRTERLGAVRARYGAEAETTATACGELATTYFRAGDLAAARGMFERQIELINQQHGPGSAESIPAIALLGDVAVAAQDRAAAIKARERLVAACQKHFGAQHREYGRAILLLGEALLNDGATDRAEKLLRTAYPLVKSDETDAAPARTASALARVCLKRGNTDEAERWTRDALAGTSFKEEALAESLSQLGDEWLRAGQANIGEDTLIAVLAILSETAGDHDEHTLAVLEKLARLRLQAGQFGAAELLDRAFAGSEAFYGSDAPATANLLGWLVLARVHERQFSEAHEAARQLAGIPSSIDPVLVRQLEAWTGLLAARGDKAEALRKLTDALPPGPGWWPAAGTVMAAAFADLVSATEPVSPAL